MKNSKEYAKRVQEFVRLAKKKFTKTTDIRYDEPLEALVDGALFETLPYKKAEHAKKMIEQHFINLNDLRVSLVREIVEAIGEDTPESRQAAERMTRILRYIFEKKNSLSLLSTKKLGKRPARAAFEKIDGASPFCIDYCMLTALQAHSIPLSQMTLDYLLENEIVHPSSKSNDIQGFLTRQITSKNGCEFYILLQKAAESKLAMPFAPKKTKKSVKKKAVKKTAKKKTAKKTTKKKTDKSKKKK